MKHTITLVSLLIAGGIAHGATALIDFSDAASAGAGWDVIGTAGTTGNAADVSATTLSTGWTIALDFDNVTNTGVGGTGINANAGTTITEANAIVDGLFINNNTATISITIAGLADGVTYGFVAHTGRNSDGVDATVAGQTATWAAGGGQEISFSQIAAGGEITFDFTSAGNNATLNALSITAIPEPSSAALLGLGGLALILRRRK